jgi:DNA-3-methyladenine glycosylase II
MKKAIKYLSAVDKTLAAHIKAIGPCSLEPKRSRTPFYSLAQSIAYQQLTGKAAETIWGRVVASQGGVQKVTPANILSTSPDVLRSAGLSHAKVASLLDLADHAQRRIIPGWAALEKLDDEEIIERISSVRGIGPWTVQMMLIFSLGRLDVLPATDYGVQKGFSVVYRKKELPKPKELIAYAERWKPYRSIASWYMWRALDTKGGRA